MNRLLLWLLLTLAVAAQEPNIPRVSYQDFADHSVVWAENQLQVDATLKRVDGKPGTGDRAALVLMKDDENLPF